MSRSDLGVPPLQAASLAPPPAPAPAAAQPYVNLDPAVLRPRLSIRSGASSLAVDEHRLRLRSWFRRTELPWADVLSFEIRSEGVGASGSGGHLVANTRSGPVELPATKRSMSDLRYLQALLEAYRRRAGHG